MTYMDVPGFRGYVTLFCIDEVQSPLIAKYTGQDICLADNGYMWLQHFPRSSSFTVTTIFNQQGELIRWYIDICKQHGMDNDGMLWYDDLYLDIDVSPEGATNLLDADELDDALREEKITSLEYNLAWREVNTLLTAIEEDNFPLLWLCEVHLNLLLKLV
jgi:predicted RNA-binding protein associated with RNAse of E/G family